MTKCLVACVIVLCKLGSMITDRLPRFFITNPVNPRMIRTTAHLNCTTYSIRIITYLLTSNISDFMHNVLRLLCFKSLRKNTAFFALVLRSRDIIKIKRIFSGRL